MRKARYDMKQVRLPNASTLGYGQYVAKPGYWVVYGEEGFQRGRERMGRVLGRIAESEYGMAYADCKGWLAVLTLGDAATHAFVRWVNPADVLLCYEEPPRALLEWITGDEWVKSKDDIAKIIAMGEHGTLSEQFIGNRHDPKAAYNARPEYVKQFILGD